MSQTTDSQTLTDPTQRRFRGSAKISEYDVLTEKLGEGTFGIVSKARSKRTGNIVALKKILLHNEKDGFPITALREIKLLKMLSHPNVLKLDEMAVERQSVDDKGKNGKKRATLSMVMPYMEHDLSGMLTNPDIRFHEAQIKCYMQQLLEGLKYLHNSHILHRDMKAANILISNRGLLQIADFGLARHYEGQVPQPGRGNGEAVRDYTSLVVTRWYRPPELLLTLKKYTPAIDMWGVGCVFAEIFEGKPILEGKSDVDQCYRIFKLIGSPNDATMPGWSDLPGCEGQREWKHEEGDIDSRFGPRLGKQGLNLLKQLLCLDWRKRINATDALQHEYFTTAPLPATPESLPRYEDSHELDSRKRGREQHRALPAAPAGGTVGMGPDEWTGSGPPVNGYGYNDRPPARGYGGRDNRGPPRYHDDRRPPPPQHAEARQPTWKQDRPTGPPINGHRPPLGGPADLPPRPDMPARGPPPPVGRRPGVDTFIPSYSRDAQAPDNYDRDRRGSRGSRDSRESDRPPYRDPDAPRPRADRPSYRDIDAPGRPPPSRDGYRDRDRDDWRRDGGGGDQRRTRSRSPPRHRERDRESTREELRERERDLYRR